MPAKEALPTVQFRTFHCSSDPSLCGAPQADKVELRCGISLEQSNYVGMARSRGRFEGRFSVLVNSVWIGTGIQ